MEFCGHHYMQISCALHMLGNLQMIGIHQQTPPKYEKNQHKLL